VLLDDLWLQGLLGQRPPPLSLLAPLPDEQTSDTDRATAPLVGVQRIDWGDALTIPTFYGREWEMDLLTRWVVEERCRVVSVLGNVETLLEEGEGTGRMRPGYEGYARLLRRVAETAHQSCLLLTSREKPGDLVPLEGSGTPVRALRLVGLERDASEQLLEERQ